MKSNLRQSLLAAVAATLVSASSPQIAIAQTADSYFESAKSYYFNEDSRSTLIELKNALQNDPEHVPSLVLLGQTYLRTNTPSAAEEALIKARVLGADSNLISNLLAEAYLQQFKYNEIINGISETGLSPSQRAKLLAHKANAWLSLGDSKKSEEFLSASYQASPGNLNAELTHILLLMSKGELQRAEELAKQTTAKHPNNAEALNQYASTLHLQGRIDEANTLYLQSLELDPQILGPRLARISILLDKNNPRGTLPDLSFLEEHFPTEPRAAYLRGEVYSRLTEENPEFADRATRQFQQSAEFIAQLPTPVVSSNSQLAMAAALSHFALKEYSTAAEYLENYLKRNPGDVGAIKLNGQALLETGNAVAAIQTLRPAHQRHPKDKVLLELLAEAYNSVGQHDKATELLSMLTVVDSSPSSTTQLALSQLREGKSSAGIAALQSSLTNEPNDLEGGFNLVIAELRRGNVKAASQLAQQLASRHPTSPQILNLLGITQKANGELQAARETFDRLVAQHPDQQEAIINLAKIEEQLGDKTSAEARLLDLMKSEVQSAQPLLALGLLKSRNGDHQSALENCKRAATLSPSNLDTHHCVVEQHLALKDLSEAESAAVEATRRFDNDFASSHLLAQTHLKIGQPRKALSIYKRLTKEAGFNTENLYRIASHLIDMGALEDARHALFKGLEGDPQHTASRINYIRVQLTLKEFEDALSNSHQLREQNPEDIRSYILLGDSYQGLGKTALAEAEYRRGLVIQYDYRLLLGQYTSLTNLGQHRQAENLLKAHLKNDRQATRTEVAELLVDHFIAQRDFEQAKVYLDTLPKNSSDPIQLNNTAFVHGELGLPDALKYAERAYQLSPEDPNINDTLGWLLVKQNNPEQGLKYLRQAVTRQSGDPDIRYHLAAALAITGREAESRHELNQLLDLNETFSSRPQAEQLLKKLTN